MLTEETKIMQVPHMEKHNKKILIVDDNPEICMMLKVVLFHFGLDSTVAFKGKAALVSVEKDIPDLILLDIQMPGLNGFQVCEILKQDTTTKDIPIIFISGQGSAESKAEAFRVGGVDYITKPFDCKEVAARIRVHLNLCPIRYKEQYQHLVAENIREMSEAQQATIFALAKLAEKRDGDTGIHLERVREYCRLISEKLAQDSPYASHITPDFIKCIQHASALHDIGKVAVPDNILQKPGVLTKDEYEIMKHHTVTGAENLQSVYDRYKKNIFIGMGIEIALHHHERWDGSGYPNGLVGENIPLSARIMALADCYDALCSDRCYRKAMHHERANDMITAQSGTHFDPELVKTFVALQSDFRQIVDAAQGWPA